MAGKIRHIFTSWSGTRSKEVALALQSLLEELFEVGFVFVSDNISPGEVWSQRLGKELEQSEFGILCLTQDNYDSPWLLFEAGALGKKFGASQVVPYLIDELPADSEKSPLWQFQYVRADEPGTLRLIQTINAKRENPKPPDRLEKSFHKWWPDLDETLKRLRVANPDRTTFRSDRELLESISKRVEALWLAHNDPKTSSMSLFLSSNELVHLQNLRDQPATTYTRDPNLQKELRHLRDLGLIKNKKAHRGSAREFPPGAVLQPYRERCKIPSGPFSGIANVRLARKWGTQRLLVQDPYVSLHQRVSQG